jgi:hypothetical protein
LTRRFSSVRASLLQPLLRLRRLASVAVAAATLAPVVHAAEIPADMRIDWNSIVVSREELLCLAQNDYWEARSEVMAGRIAVARVVLNRAMDPRFPANLCDVIRQNKAGGGVLNRCQFSWYCDEKPDEIIDSKEWRDSIKIAVALTQKDSSIPDPTGGALWYHADFTQPAWAMGFESTTIIGTHVFYREPDGGRAASAPRRPFIYRLNAFAEFAAKRNARITVAASSAVAVKDGAVASQPLAR